MVRMAIDDEVHLIKFFSYHLLLSCPFKLAVYDLREFADRNDFLEGKPRVRFSAIMLGNRFYGRNCPQVVKEQKVP